MKRKWQDSRGETLVEVLTAILICALSIALLFTATTASSNLNKAARDADKKFAAGVDAALYKAEQQTVPFADPFDPPITAEEAKITVENTGIPDPLDSSKNLQVKVEVTYYGDEGAISYKLP